MWIQKRCSGLNSGSSVGPSQTNQVELELEFSSLCNKRAKLVNLKLGLAPKNNSFISACLQTIQAQAQQSSIRLVYTPTLDTTFVAYGEDRYLTQLISPSGRKNAQK